jgi:hypothetical protein
MAQDLEALGSSTGYEVGHEEARDRDPGLQSKLQRPAVAG